METTQRVRNRADGGAFTQAYGRSMTTITALSTATERRPRTTSLDHAAAATTPVAPSEPLTAEQYQLQTARDSKRLGYAFVGVTLFVLVFFLAMMWVLAGYGPAGS